jgi:hypothetical protein
LIYTERDPPLFEDDASPVQRLGSHVADAHRKSVTDQMKVRNVKTNMIYSLCISETIKKTRNEEQYLIATSWLDKSLKVYGLQKRGYAIKELLNYRNICPEPIKLMKFTHKIDRLIVADSDKIKILELSTEDTTPLKNDFLAKIETFDISFDDVFLICGTQINIEIFDLRT